MSKTIGLIPKGRVAPTVADKPKVTAGAKGGGEGAKNTGQSKTPPKP